MPRIIGGTERSRILTAPEGADTRPTMDRVRENLYNILQGRVRGAKVLDLFAGSGATGLEAISRGASSAVLVDHSPRAAQAIRTNIRSLRYEGVCQFLQQDWQPACKTLQEAGKVFSLIFLDPPYTMNDLTSVMGALSSLMTEQGMVVVEHEAHRIPLIGDGWEVVQQRRYGIAGLIFLTRG